MADRVYFIAEMGLCHYGSLDLALLMIEQAKAAGADAVKTQAFGPGLKLPYAICRHRRLNADQLEECRKKAADFDLDFILTPHDDYGLELVKAMDCPCIKVGSGEVGNFPFLKKIKSLGIPVIASTGMHNEAELRKLVSEVEPEAILHCVSAYPATDLNLGRISLMRLMFGCEVGYSDHSGLVDAASYAVAAGAKIVEVHFHPGITVADSNDAKASLSPEYLKACVSNVRQAEYMMGDGSPDMRPEEISTLEWARKDPETNRRGTSH